MRAIGNEGADPARLDRRRTILARDHEQRESDDGSHGLLRLLARRPQHTTATRPGIGADRGDRNLCCTTDCVSYPILTTSIPTSPVDASVTCTLQGSCACPHETLMKTS